MSAVAENDQPRISYSRESLLRAREKHCPGLPRQLRRTLFKYKLLNRQQCVRSHSTPKFIKVRITHRRHRSQCLNHLEFHPRYPKSIRLSCQPEQRPPASSSRKQLRSQRQPRVLTKVKCVCSRRRSTTHPPKVLPSLLLSNVRSLANKLDEIEVRIVSLNPDLIVFTETWLDSDTPDESVTLRGYSIVRKDRNKFGGGIIIYVSLKLSFVVIDSNDVPSIDACNTEILPINFMSLNLLIVSIYHPFWKDAIKNERAISCITDIIDHVVSLSAYPDTVKIVICGDFNDLVTDIYVLENSFDLKRIATKVTRGSRVLDQIVTNIKSDYTPNVSAPFGCSDHAVVTWYPQLPAAPVTVKKKIRNFSLKNRRSFETAMSLVNWQLLDGYPDVDFAVDTLHKVLQFLFDTCFPYVTVRFRSTDPVWMNGTLKVLMDKRDRAFYNKNFVKYRYLRSNVIKYMCV